MAAGEDKVGQDKAKAPMVRIFVKKRVPGEEHARKGATFESILQQVQNAEFAGSLEEKQAQLDAATNALEARHLRQQEELAVHRLQAAQRAAESAERRRVNLKVMQRGESATLLDAIKELYEEVDGEEAG